MTGVQTCALPIWHGAKVSIFDIQVEEGLKTAKMIREAGGDATFIQADVTKADQIDRAFDEAVETFGPYNVLFNHAGTIIVKPLHETTEEEYDSLMRSEEHTSELQSRRNLVCRLLLEKKN